MNNNTFRIYVFVLLLVGNMYYIRVKIV